MSSENLSRLFVHAPLRETLGIPDFLFEDEYVLAQREQMSDGENLFKNFFKRWPRFYEVLVSIVAPVLFTGLTAKKFVRRFKRTDTILNVGSGPTRLHPGVVNVDLYPFQNVDVLAKGERLPFRDASFDGAICDTVLEHVYDPDAVASEIVRVTKPGGLIYISVPFLYPLHPSPKDYVRWSVEGVWRLLPGCEIVESGQATGPTSGMLVTFAAWLAIVFSFGFSPLRKILLYVFMLLLFPFKYLDLVFSHFPGAETIAATVYVVARKR